uniref:Threonyl/alanyl tRNA synthetase SAD domain-containing protein n=1 Tax=Timema poppense TaxID=170557 RepID=A0A7R9CH98_TIMPO|nr:unnamed protein product [Timema poppensis]
MVFACQTDSFLKEFTAKVLSCKEASLKTVINGKKELLNGFEVILDDTILFPEGGGQPCDRGFLGSVPVVQVSQHGTDAVHFVTEPLVEGETVRQMLDWDRRLDHMQQHSGQHLVTAIADLEFGYPTTSWWLGEEVSYIELDTPTIKQEEITNIEQIVNDKIRASLPVDMEVFGEVGLIPETVRTRGLPDGHKGPVRVVTIQGVDSNMCCGTHVSNLCQLQVIKLLHAEKGKKNKTNLHFLVGGRVLKHLAGCLEREQKFTALLKGGPTDHVNLVDKLQKSLKLTNKNLQTVLKDLAVLEAEKLKRQDPLPKYYCLHRKEGDTDFMNVFINEVSNQKVLLFLTVGEYKGAGQMVLYGESQPVSQLGPKVCEMLKGKGAGKGPKFQAKVSNMENRAQAEHIIEQYFNSLN